MLGRVQVRRVGKIVCDVERHPWVGTHLVKSRTALLPASKNAWIVLVGPWRCFATMICSLFAAAFIAASHLNQASEPGFGLRGWREEYSPGREKKQGAVVPVST